MIHLSPRWGYVGSLVHWWLIYGVGTKTLWARRPRPYETVASHLQKGIISDENSGGVTYMLLVLFLSDAYPQEDTQLNLPEGAVKRFGKGSIRGGSVFSGRGAPCCYGSIGIWLYDTTTYRAVALLAGKTGAINSVAFSPDGVTLASGSNDNKVWLWDVRTGEPKAKHHREYRYDRNRCRVQPMARRTGDWGLDSAACSIRREYACP